MEFETRYRREARRLSGGARRRGGIRLVVLFAAIAAAFVGSQTAEARTSSFGATASTTPAASTRSSPWSSYVADEATCPGADAVDAPVAAQVRAMVCLVNYARATRGLRKLRLSPKLSAAARMKMEQIQRCGVFDHAPCGGSPTAVADRVGYSGAFGENLYIGESSLGSAREALKEWLASPPHRRNMFSASWRVQSLYAAHMDELDGFVDATVWVAQFGDR